MENSNPLKFNDPHSEINYNSKWCNFFSKRLLGGNELDTLFVFLVEYFSFHFVIKYLLIFW